MRSQDPVDKSAYRQAEVDPKKLLYETKRKYFDEMLRMLTPPNLTGLISGNADSPYERSP